MRREAGYTIIEWMIVLVIGLFITAGVTSVFVSGRSTNFDTHQVSQMQDNGRIAAHLLIKDIKQAGFWGAYTGAPLVADSGISVPVIASDCIDGGGSGIFPDNSGNWHDLWSFQIPLSLNTGSLPCIDDGDASTQLIPLSDVLVVKRAAGRASPTISEDKYYLSANASMAVIFTGESNKPTDEEMPSSTLWEYVNHIYYLDRDLDSGIPRLRRLSLTSNGLELEPPLVEGVEMMRFLFGIDTNGDGSADRYETSDKVTASEWDLDNIVGMRLHLLVRSISESNTYENKAQFKVADLAISGGSDGFRRMLYTSSVALSNSLQGEE